MGRTTHRISKFKQIAISDARKPVFGMLTEPLRGDLVNFEDKSDRYSGKTSYVPRSHVQFLE